MAKKNTEVEIDIAERNMSLSKLYKLMSKDKNLFEFILKDEPFPDFGSFVRQNTFSRKLHSLLDGMGLLLSYARSKNIKQEEFTLVQGIYFIIRNNSIKATLLKPNEYRAAIQSKKQQDRDNAGLLGSTVHQTKKKQNTRKITRSVWTVKK